MEGVVEVVDKDLNKEKREDLHKILRAYTDILSKNFFFLKALNNQQHKTLKKKMKACNTRR